MSSSPHGLKKFLLLYNATDNKCHTFISNCFCSTNNKSMYATTPLASTWMSSADCTVFANRVNVQSPGFFISDFLPSLFYAISVVCTHYNSTLTQSKNTKKTPTNSDDVLNYEALPPCSVRAKREVKIGEGC